MSSSPYLRSFIRTVAPTKTHALGHVVGVHDLRVRQAAFEFSDIRFHHALVFPGGVVVGVFFEVAQRARFGDALRDLGALGFEFNEALFETRFFVCCEELHRGAP